MKRVKLMTISDSTLWSEKMVNRCWAKCSLCAKNVIGELNVLVPVCLYCGVEIEKKFFHEHCVREIYNFLEHKIIEKYEEKLKIYCVTCSSGVIGFDFIDVNED